MHANNEIGSIQAIREIGQLAGEKEIYFHTDAVQSLGHIPVDVNELAVDLLSGSAHKLYGPKGVGILYVRKGTIMSPFMHGGDQEKGRRASTHNVPGIVGFGKAIELAKEEIVLEMENLSALRDYLIKGIISKIDGSFLNGHPEKRLPNNVNLSIPNIEGESVLMHLDMEGVACSTGSACASSAMEASHVLTAIGVPPEVAHGSLRFSLGRSTTRDEIDHVLEVLPAIADKLRAMSLLD
jgi:cysteine desulfurase